MNNNIEQKRIGRGMLAAFWVLLLVVLVFAFGSWEKDQYNPNRSIEGTSSTSARILELERNAYGHYLVTGEINQHRAVFILDTGATDVAVPEGVARTLGLKRGTAHQVRTANGIATAFRTNIPILKIGTITLSNVRASITPGMQGQEILLGMSALKQLDFSQSGNILTLTQHLQP